MQASPVVSSFWLRCAGTLGCHQVRRSRKPRQCEEVFRTGAPAHQAVACVSWFWRHTYCKSGTACRARYAPRTTARSRQCQGLFLLWLVCTPQVSGVQIWQHSSLQGQPVFTTSSVQSAYHVEELSPVRTPDAPCVDPAFAGQPAPIRSIGVFQDGANAQPVVMHADVRMQGPLLDLMLCRAFGLQHSCWNVRRVLATLPSLPAEQYILSPRTMPWYDAHTPVDLRPVGGRISLVVTRRDLPCGAVVDAALTAQGLRLSTDYLCRTNQGLFHPDARLGLLPYGDAFQVWPADRLPLAPVGSSAPSIEPPPSCEDRFTTSISYPGTSELAFHEANGANAVIIHSHGFVYACVPSFADHETISSAAFSAVTRDIPSTSVFHTFFVRVMPPLDRLPAIQFVAAPMQHDLRPGLVDLRPVGGGISIVMIERGASPNARLERAIAQQGEPHPQYPLETLVARGVVCVLHREQVVDPARPLHGEPPCPVTLVRRIGTGSVRSRDDLSTDHTLPGSPRSLGFGTGPRVALALWSCGQGWFGLCLLAIGSFGLHVAEAVQAPDPASMPHARDGLSCCDCCSELEPIASVQAHRALAGLIGSVDSRDRLAPLAGAADGCCFQFCVWSPGDRLHFTLPVDALCTTYREKLRDIQGQLGRGRCVALDPPLIGRCVHLASSSSVVSAVTVVADTGTDILCLDVPRIGFGASILAAVQAILPGRLFRIFEGVRAPVRHGDVVQLCSDDRPLSAEVGRFSLHASAGPPQQRSVFVTAADMGLIRLTVPSTASHELLNAAMLQWFGRQRCLGLSLQRVDVGNVPFELYCLPRRRRDTLTVVLTDFDSALLHPVATSVDVEPGQQINCASLPQLTHEPFWEEVVARGPACLRCKSAALKHGAGDSRFVQIAIGLDVCRAISTGWHVTQEARPDHYDLVTHSNTAGIDWGYGPGAPPQRSVQVQTNPPSRPMASSPLISGSLPVPRRAHGCSFDDRLSPGGTLHHLECPNMQVRCTLPCISGFHTWALRIGNWVYAACTASVTWNEVLVLGGLTPWDLPGSSIHGVAEAWVYPQDISSLSGQCGHLFHEGSDPYLTAALSAPVCTSTSAVETATTLDPPTSESRPLGYSHVLAWFVILFSPGRPGAWILVGLALGELGCAGQTASSSESIDEVQPVQNSTRTCTVAWCHELACQQTHFAVVSSALAAYFRSHAPTQWVRIYLWLPFEGPVALDVPRDVDEPALTASLVAAGHDNTRHVLHVAFDSQSNTLDVLSVPSGNTVWWIVRDGTARELLRPVMPWYEDQSRMVATLNSHGQAISVAPSPEVANLIRLPQGARGILAVPLSHVHGYVTVAGLVLSEARFIAARSKVGRPVRLGLLLLALCTGVQGMQSQQISVARSHVSWGANSETPRVTYIWTHSLAAPVVVGYQAQPDPFQLARAVADTNRGVRTDGVFDWALPSHVHDAGHVLHYPAGVNPPFVFWLLHYRGRGAVMAAIPGSLDWQMLAYEAGEAFGVDSIAGGNFGIQHNGRIYAYGTQLLAPPHRTILHIVRTGGSTASTNQSPWDSTPDMPWIPQFDFAICRGARGEDALVAGRPVMQSVSEADALSRRLQALALRCETALDNLLSICTRQVPSPSNEAQVGHPEPVEPSSAGSTVDQPTNSALHRRAGAGVWLCIALRGALTSRHGFLVYIIATLVAIPPGLAQGDDDSPTGPEEPSSPDLTDLQAPTPLVEVANPVDPRGVSHIRMSEVSEARTSAPVQGDLSPQLTPFDRSNIPAVQRLVAALLNEVDLERPPIPFIQQGCPVTMHNPFTQRSQCQAMTAVVHSAQYFREILQDYAGRRGWQPLVPVSPQPDSDSLHLIPVAADPELVSVVFRSGNELHPCCVPQRIRRNPFARITLNGRQGRIREPYPVNSGRHSQLSLRNGDCLHADVGPYGPPPPEPARSAVVADLASSSHMPLGESGSRGCYWA